MDCLFVTNEAKGVKIDNIEIVKEYLDVFADELCGLPPDRQIEFGIDIMLEARVPYRLVPSKNGRAS